MPSYETYPPPQPNPCGAGDYATVTFTIPNCRQYMELLIGHLNELTDPDSYDDDPDIDYTIGVYQDMIDLAIYGSSP